MNPDLVKLDTARTHARAAFTAAGTGDRAWFDEQIRQVHQLIGMTGLFAAAAMWATATLCVTRPAVREEIARMAADQDSVPAAHRWAALMMTAMSTMDIIAAKQAFTSAAPEDGRPTDLLYADLWEAATMYARLIRQTDARP